MSYEPAVILGVLDLPKSQLDHKLHHRTQFFLFPLFSIFEEKILKIDDSKMAIFGHFFCQLHESLSQN